MRLQVARRQGQEDARYGSVDNYRGSIARPRAIAWPATAGLLSPLIFFTAVVIAGLLRRDYDPVAQFVSELGTGPHAWLFNGAIIACGALELPFLLTLNDAITSQRWPRTTRRLFMLACAVTILLGLIPTRHRVQLTDTSVLHILGFCVASMALVMGALLLAMRFSDDANWRGMIRLTRVCAALAIILLASPLALWPDRWYAWAGLIQRMLLLVLLFWLEMMAIAFVLHADAWRPAFGNRP
jgi:hypothetical membrane protein